jgi:hypothetical protein
MGTEAGESLTLRTEAGESLPLRTEAHGQRKPLTCRKSVSDMVKHPSGI